ncbi:MAG TPA: hypothetical protein VGX68_12005 [Thermoanaerobaculia bacterium]|jgi:hypothetical protein|nr:hypothetical protein [Thermoanaerobaculia bacterium]
MPNRLLSVALLALAAHLVPAGPVFSLPLAAEGPARSVDSELVRMGREIPGFGGLFYDGQGRPTVYLLHPEGATAAALKRLGPQLQVRQGDYEFEHLLAWRHELRPLLGLPGVVLLDVDETRNRVVLGLDSTSRNKSLDRDRVERQLLFTGVPRQAVLLEEMGPISELVSLESKIRPAAGGVQIAFPIDPPSYGVCTLGFNAYSGKIFGFVINAHCTAERGAVDGVRYVQSMPSGGAIGTEILDPGFSTDPPCPANRRCRFSDSAFAKYDKKNLGALGKIARPTFGGSDFGSVTLNPASARFTITGRQASPFVGDTVHKVGRTTGWTYGTVVATCTDISSSSSDVTEFCQSVVQAASGAGDSGSPVFYRIGGKNNVKLVGILWGGGFSSALGNIFVFSPLENIEDELGPLKVN